MATEIEANLKVVRSTESVRAIILALQQLPQDAIVLDVKRNGTLAQLNVEDEGYMSYEFIVATNVVDKSDGDALFAVTSFEN